MAHPGNCVPSSDVVARLELLEAEVCGLRAENADLRRGLAPPPPQRAEPTGAPTGGVDRRRLLRTGLVAGAAVVGAVVIDSAPAAAAQGGSVILGQGNDAGTATTTIDTSIGNGHPGFVLRNNGNGDGVQALSTNANAFAGTSSTGAGVSGTSTNGNGVFGTSGTFHGVYGEASGSYAAVFGSSLGISPAVHGNAGSGNGVRAISVSGTGVFASSVNGAAATLEAPGLGPQLLLSSPNPRSAPPTDNVAHVAGEIILDSNHDVWCCVTAGTPGSWRKLTGPAAAGSFQLLTTPVRVYDSRPGTAPNVGSKTPLAPNSNRPLDLKANASTVPADAGGVMVNLLLVNLGSGTGNFSLWANGTTKPQSNTMVFANAATGGRASSLAVTRVDGTGLAQVSSSVATDLVVDVVGYYR